MNEYKIAKGEEPTTESIEKYLENYLKENNLQKNVQFYKAYTFQNSEKEANKRFYVCMSFDSDEHAAQALENFKANQDFKFGNTKIKISKKQLYNDRVNNQGKFIYVKSFKKETTEGQVRHFFEEVLKIEIDTIVLSTPKAPHEIKTQFATIALKQTDKSNKDKLNFIRQRIQEIKNDQKEKGHDDYKKIFDNQARVNVCYLKPLRQEYINKKQRFQPQHQTIEFKPPGLAMM